MEHSKIMSEPQPPDPDEPMRGDETGLGRQDGVESFFRPVVEDEGLRPVVLSVFIGLSTVFGWGMLLAVRDFHPAAVLALLAVAGLTIEIIVRGRRERGRIGVAGWSLLAVWIGGTVFAVGGAWSGYL